MFLNKPKIFQEFPEVIFGFSKKMTNRINDPFQFNFSFSIMDNNDIVMKNRTQFFNELGFSHNDVVVQKQIHSDIVNTVNEFSTDMVGDALITKKKNLGLAISTADCTNIYLYDPRKKIIAAVHSGWEGTEKKILSKTIEHLKGKYGVNPLDLFVYFGPSISQRYYEVGETFKDKFDAKYLIPFENKYKLDLKSANLDMAIGHGISLNQIEVSEICSFENHDFHSYRRDKSLSGRALGVIALRY